MLELPMITGASCLKGPLNGEGQGSAPAVTAARPPVTGIATGRRGRRPCSCFPFFLEPRRSRP
jgi:hypothetical protein